MVQQMPVTWAAWKTLLEYIGPDGVLTQPLERRVMTQGHQTHRWYMDCDAQVIYSNDTPIWMAYPST
jgi:hypothetical protein